MRFPFVFSATAFSLNQPLKIDLKQLNFFEESLLQSFTDENANNLLTEEATEDSAEKVCSARSLSPTNTEPIENDDKSEDLIKNEDDKDYDTKKQTPDNGIEQQPELSGNEEDSFLDTADNFDKPAKESKNQHYLGVGSSPGKTKRSTNLASTNILSW